MAASALFVWEGTDKQGRRAKGEIASSNPAIAKAELRKQGINATRVRKKGGGLQPQQRQEHQLRRHLAVHAPDGNDDARRASRSCSRSRSSPTASTNRSCATSCCTIRSDVSSGNTFASALRKHPVYFDDLFCNLVDAGEQSGSLETMLDRIASYKEKTESLKAKVRKAMTYPIAVVVVAVIVSGILLIKVVPQFQTVFAGFGAELPAFTMFVIHISEVVQAYWILFLLAIAAAIAGFTVARRRSKPLRDAIDRTALKMPVVGNIIEKSAVARFARTLSTTFAAGVPLVDALNSVAGATGNSVYVNAVYKVRDDVSTGQQLNFSMRSTGVFPNMVIQMVAIGEESGALDTHARQIGHLLRRAGRQRRR